MDRVLITGGSGMIGTRLTDILEKRGYSVVHLSRRGGTDRTKIFFWDISKGLLDEEALRETTYIVHLAGENIASGRWNEARKREIINSRVHSLDLLAKKLKERKVSVKALISASAVGIYKKNSDENLTEASAPDNDFLGTTCTRWEEAAGSFSNLGIRVVKIRTGVVLSDTGGALPKMAAPVKFFFGSPLGRGTQIVPWVHLDDICEIYLKAIEDESLSGAYNAVAPFSVSNSELTMALARALKKPLIAPNVPEFVIRALFGELSSLVLDSQRVSPEKILKSGFRFEFSDINDALENIFVPVKKVW